MDPSLTRFVPGSSCVQPVVVPSSPSSGLATQRGTVENAVVLSGCASESEAEDLISRQSSLTNEDDLRNATYKFVIAEYLYCLGRTPNTSGLAIWTVEVQAGRLEGLRDAICDSKEGTLANLYFELLTHWLERDAPPDAVAEAIRSSPEFGTVTNAKKLSFQAVREARAVAAQERMKAVKALRGT